MLCSVINKSSNREILMFWVSLKNLSFREGVHEKPIHRGGLPKKGVLDSKFKGGHGKKEGVVFLRRGVDTPMHIMRSPSSIANRTSMLVKKCYS